LNCSCPSNELVSKQLQKLENELLEMAVNAKRLVKTASDPISAMIRFLHERPENVSLNGLSIKTVLVDAFGSYEQVPGLLRLLSAHVRDVVRHSNVIAIYNEHFSQGDWGGYLIKVKENIRFEVSRDRDKLLVLKNIAGLICVEHGIELPLETIRVNPPKLEVTVKLGLLRPTRVVDILA
jgi:hypothetical protein